MAYIHYINGNKYGVNYITYNHYEVLKNGLLEESFDTFEEAQHFIDDIISSNQQLNYNESDNKKQVQKRKTKNFWLASFIVYNALYTQHVRYIAKGL